MSSDLETQLVAGGVTPVAAKVISNALANVASERVSLGRHVEDVTPSTKMRLINADTRRYLLTNLDYSGDSRANPSAQYSPRSRQHPYQDSQPATATPTLSTPGVKAGQFVSVQAKTQNQVSQAEVALNVQSMGGSHARINAATGAIEAVPIVVQFEPDGLLEGDVVEEAGRTVIRIRVVGTALRGLLKKRLGAFSSVQYQGQPCVLNVDGQAVAAGGAFVVLSE